MSTCWESNRASRRPCLDVGRRPVGINPAARLQDDVAAIRCESLFLSLARVRSLSLCFSLSLPPEARTKGAPVEFVASGALTGRSSLPLPLALSSPRCSPFPHPPPGRPSVSLDPSPFPSVALSRRHHVYSFFYPPRARRRDVGPAERETATMTTVRRRHNQPPTQPPPPPPPPRG